MAEASDIDALKEQGRALLALLKRHHAFVRRTVATYEAKSNGGQVTYAAAVLRREIEGLETVLENCVDFETLGPPDRVLHVAMARSATLLAELRPTYDPEGHHHAEIRSDWSGLTPHIQRRLRHDVPRLHDALGDVIARIQSILPLSSPGAGAAAARPVAALEDDATGAARRTAQVKGDATADSSRAGNGGGRGGGNSQEDSRMSNGNHDDIVDAISRLQGATGAGAGGSSAANAINAFSSQLDQTLNLTLGMPALTSDAAKALPSDVLVGKLFEGLSRTVAGDTIGGVRAYEVNPLRARGAAQEGQGAALGAQAVSAATIRSLKDPILTNVYKLVSETTYGEQDEAEDLRVAIASGLDQLIAEANADTGIYQNWAQEILLQIGIDLFRLAAQYGILDANRLPENLHDLLYSVLIADEPDGILTLEELRNKLFFKPAFDRILRDPDIGILTAEANDKAFVAVVHKLSTIARLIPPQVELGPILGRIRALNDALPASVISARNALAIAGISEADQAVTFSKMAIAHSEDSAERGPRASRSTLTYTAGGISLRRLLSWIEAESLTSRTQYLREDLNQRDIQRLIAPRRQQRSALEEIIARDFAMVNSNAYAIGRRHLNEVSRHLAALVELMGVLVTVADRAASPGEGGSAAGNAGGGQR